MPTLAGKKHPSVQFFLHGASFPPFDGKSKGPISRKGFQSGYFYADTIDNNINKGDRNFHNRKIVKYSGKSNLEYGKKVYNC